MCDSFSIMSLIIGVVVGLKSEHVLEYICLVT